MKEQCLLLVYLNKKQVQARKQEHFQTGRNIL